MAKKSAFSKCAGLLLDCHSVCLVELFLYFAFQTLAVLTAVHFQASAFSFPSFSFFFSHSVAIFKVMATTLQAHPQLLSCSTQHLYHYQHMLHDEAPCARLPFHSQILRRSLTNPFQAHRQISSLLLLLGQISGLVAWLGLAHQISVGWRAEKAWIAVFGHEHVDLVLGHVETRMCGGQHIGFGDVTGFVVNINLQKKDTRYQVESLFDHLWLRLL